MLSHQPGHVLVRVCSAKEPVMSRYSRPHPEFPPEIPGVSYRDPLLNVGKSFQMRTFPPTLAEMNSFLFG